MKATEIYMEATAKMGFGPGTSVPQASPVMPAMFSNSPWMGASSATLLRLKKSVQHPGAGGMARTWMRIHTYIHIIFTSHIYIHIIFTSLNLNTNLYIYASLSHVPPFLSPLNSLEMRNALSMLNTSQIL